MTDRDATEVAALRLRVAQYHADRERQLWGRWQLALAAAGYLAAAAIWAFGPL